MSLKMMLICRLVIALRTREPFPLMYSFHMQGQISFLFKLFATLVTGVRDPQVLTLDVKTSPFRGIENFRTLVTGIDNIGMVASNMGPQITFSPTFEGTLVAVILDSLMLRLNVI